MSDRDILAPLALLGLGAAGAWGAWHYLRPKGKGTPKDDAAPPTQAPPLASPPQAPPAAPPEPAPVSELAVGSSVSAPLVTADRNGPTRVLDPILAPFAFATRIPIAYLRALAWSESRMKPEIPGGLFQIIGKTREDFARRHKQAASSLDLNSPATNTMIAVDTLTTIKASLAKNHPNQLHTRADWTNAHFVELLTLSWNGGWSESSGVGRALDYFDGSGFLSVTIDDIANAAPKILGLARHLEDPRRYSYARAVAARFITERTRDTIAQYDPTGLLSRRVR